TADISLTNCGTGAVTRSSLVGLTITGNGHTVTQTCANKDTFANTLANAGDLTFDGVHIAMAANTTGVNSNGGGVTLTNSSITNVGGGDGISTGGAVDLTNSQITDVNGGDGISTGAPVTLTNSQITDVNGGDGIS